MEQTQKPSYREHYQNYRSQGTIQKILVTEKKTNHKEQYKNTTCSYREQYKNTTNMEQYKNTTNMEQYKK